MIRFFNKKEEKCKESAKTSALIKYKMSPVKSSWPIPQTDGKGWKKRHSNGWQSVGGSRPCSLCRVWGERRKDSSQKNLPIKRLVLSTHNISEIIEELDYLPQQICNLHMTGLRWRLSWHCTWKCVRTCWRRQGEQQTLHSA